MKQMKLKQDFDLINRSAIIAFTVICLISIQEAVFYENLEHLSITFVCVINLTLNIYKYIKR
jgi:hypothetical protein